MHKAKLSVIIDWLEFTALDAQLPDVMRLLGLKIEDFSMLSKGRFGYHNQAKWKNGNIFLMFTAIEEKDDLLDIKVNLKSGIHVMITGQGCRQYAVNGDLIMLIRKLHLHERVNFSRIDIALDDYKSKVVSYDRIHDEALAGHFTSRWSKWDEITSRRSSDNTYLGRTMYFGSQASDLFCRVYDKTLERIANSDDDKKTIPDAWTRLEVVYRKDRAKKLVEYLMQGQPLGQVLRGTLAQYMRFLVPARDKNKARWPSAPWWDLLLADVDKLTLTVKKEAKTIDEMVEWVDRQIAPTMAAILTAQGGDLAWLRSILASGSQRLSQKHKDAINQYLREDFKTT